MSENEHITKEYVKIKWDHHSEFRRFHLSLANGYTMLLNKIADAVPDFNEQLIWEDEEGDPIVMSSNEDFSYAVSLNGSSNLLKLYSQEVKANALPSNDSLLDEFRAKNVHKGVHCDSCGSEVVGIRYRCAVCANFDLCEKCERSGLHAEHEIMKRYVFPTTQLLGHIHPSRSSFSPELSEGDPSVYSFHTDFLDGCNVSILNATDDKNVKIKWNHHGEFHMYQLPLRNGYKILLNKITTVFPNFCELLTWKDEEGDPIMMSSNEDFSYAVSLNGSSNLLKLYSQEVKANALPSNYSLLDEFRAKNVHKGVHCDSCGSEVVGIRYRCAVCANFDLCEKCERSGLHAEHEIMKRYVFPKTRQLRRFLNLCRKYEVPPRGSFFNDAGEEPNFSTTNNVGDSNAPASFKQTMTNIGLNGSVLKDVVPQTLSTLKEATVWAHSVLSSLEKSVCGEAETANKGLVHGGNLDNFIAPSNSKDFKGDDVEVHNPIMETSDAPLVLADSKVRVDDEGAAVADGSTVMGNTSEDAKMSPTFSDGEDECRAGTPFVAPRPGPHSRHCFFIPEDLKVATCVQEIESMGFDNCNGWITKLSILMDGDVSRVIEALPQDEKYAEILEIEQ